jgi:GNAT superfamily N-acetyltransferase
VITFRSFHNNDPPQLAEIWRSQPTSRGIVQPMSAALLERYVLSAPMFENEGLIVAVDDNKLLGFAHAGFGPSADGQHLCTAIGGTCALMVRPLNVPSSLTDELLDRSEQFLSSRGAQTVRGGGITPLGPFYLGLSGGSMCAGILDSDREQQEFYLTHGYYEESRVAVLHCDLAKFRPPVDRRQLQIRRRTTVLATDDPSNNTWWEAATIGACDRTRFDLLPREGGSPLASLNLWNMDLLGATWGMRSVGLVGLAVALESNRRQGLAMYLVAEALRHMQGQGVMLVEVQIATTNAGVRALFDKLGFVEVDQAARYCKGGRSDAT